MKCRPGDLAVVIAAVNKCNIGRIVRVLRPYDPAVDGRFHWVVQAWIVKAVTELTWANADVCIRGTVGPALDEQLQPIRGQQEVGIRACSARKLQPIETVI